MFKFSLFNFNGNLLLKSQNLDTNDRRATKQIIDKNINIVVFVVGEFRDIIIHYKKYMNESNYTVKSEI